MKGLISGEKVDGTEKYALRLSFTHISTYIYKCACVDLNIYKHVHINTKSSENPVLNQLIVFPQHITGKYMKNCILSGVYSLFFLFRHVCHKGSFK